VPLAVRWPGVIDTPGHTIDCFVNFTDIAPTILEAADIAPLGEVPAKAGMQPITGSSLVRLMQIGTPSCFDVHHNFVLIGKERTDVGRPHDGGYPIRGILSAEGLYLKNYEPARWPAGNPETGYLDTDGSPTKSLILEMGRADRTDRFWQLNFGLRPSEEFFDLATDPDCAKNLAADPSQAERMKEYRHVMESWLRSQGDPRMAGQGSLFDQYKPTSGAGFYEQYLRGEKPKAGWITPTDIEPQPLK
jgi:N-sulfoglucosamine sulfohydrolase